jgi:hypothetical protein
MLERFLLLTKFSATAVVFAAWTVASAAGFLTYEQLGDAKAILAAAPALQTPQAHQQANAILVAATNRRAFDKARLGRIYWSPQVKLMCDAASIYPTSATLWACAEAEMGSLSEMSNPMPSAAAARQTSLSRAVGMMTAAQRLSETDKQLSTSAKALLDADRLCVTRQLTGRTAPAVCRAPFAPVTKP